MHRHDSAEPGGGSEWMGCTAYHLAGTEHPWIVAVQTGALFHNDTTKQTLFLLCGFLKQLNTHCRPWTSQVLSGPTKSVILMHSSSSWCKTWQQRRWCEATWGTPNTCAGLTLPEGCTTAPSLLFLFWPTQLAQTSAAVTHGFSTSQAYLKCLGKCSWNKLPNNFNYIYNS